MYNISPSHGEISIQSLVPLPVFFILFCIISQRRFISLIFPSPRFNFSSRVYFPFLVLPKLYSPIPVYFFPRPRFISPSQVYFLFPRPRFISLSQVYFPPVFVSPSWVVSKPECPCVSNSWALGKMWKISLRCAQYLEIFALYAACPHWPNLMLRLLLILWLTGK